MAEAKILVVEDEAIVATNIKIILAGLGYSVPDIIPTGEEALQRVAQVLPDLVLMDIRLQGEMDGVEAANLIRSRFDVPVIYLTAYADVATIKRAKITGPFGYIVKPFNVQELYAVIEMALYKHDMDRKLKESEARYRSLFNGVPVGLYRATPAGNIVDINQAALKMLGYPDKESLLAVSVKDIYVNPEDHKQWQGAIERDGFVQDFKTQNRCHDETIIWVENYARAVRDEEGQSLHYECSQIDITERVRAEKALSHRVAELDALRVTMLEITAPHDLSTLLHSIVERAAGLLNAPGGGLYICDLQAEEVRCLVSYNTTRDFTGTVLKYGEGAAGTVAQTGKSMIIDDYRTWEGRAGIFEEDHPFTAVLSTPMIWRGQVTGVIHVLHDVESRCFTKSDLELLILFADHAAIVVENARLYQEAQKEIDERVLVMAALKESEDRYRAIFEQAADSIVLIDTESGVLVEFNERAHENLGYTREEFNKLKITDFEVIESSEEVAQHIAKIIKEGVDTFETKHRTKNGEIRDIEVSSRAISIGERDFVQSIWRDITESKRAKEKLQNSEEKYRSLFDSMLNGFAYCKMLYDENNNPIDWIYLDVNDAFKEITGLDKNIIGEKVTEAIPGIKEDVPELFENYGKVASTGEEARFDIYLDTLQIWFSVLAYSPEKDYFVSVFEDITKRKYAEEALRKSEKRFHSLFDNVPVGLNRTTPTGEILDVNLALVEILGYPGRKSLLEANALDLYVDPNDRKRWQSIMDIQGVVRGFEVQLRRYDGKAVWVRSNLRAISGDNGQVQYYEGSLEDITERMRAEKALREETDRAQSYLDLAGVMFVAIDRQGDVTLINKKGCEILGYEEDEIVGQNWFENFVSESIKEVIIPVSKQLLAGEVEPAEYFENPVLTKSGEERLIAWHNTIYKDKAGNIVSHLSSGEDITERKLAEVALRDSEEKYRKLFETERDPIFLVDEDNGELVDSNPAAERLYGYTKKEFAKLKAWDLSAEPEETRKVINIQEQVGFSHVPMRYHKKKDGTVITVEISASHCRIGNRNINISMIRDITERVKATEERERLLESERDNRLLAETLAEVTLAFTSLTSQEAVLDEILQQAQRLVPTRTANIALLEDDTLRNVRWRGYETHGGEELVSSFEKPLDDLPVDADSIHSRKPVIILDTRQDSRWVVFDETAWIRSYLLVPICLHDRVLGLLRLDGDLPGTFSAEDAKRLLPLVNAAAIALENARLIERVNAGRERLHSLTRQIVSAQEDERQRLSRELHDEIGQALTALKINLELIKSDLPLEAEELLDQISHAITLTDGTMNQLRSLAHDLRPPALDTVGLNLTLGDYCHEFASRTKLAVDYQGVELPEVPDTFKITLYRFLQESLTNVARHAQAEMVLVILDIDGEKISLLVEDDGIGFDVQAVMADPRLSRGIGLSNMRERLELVGGWLEIVSKPGRGTSLIARVPVKEEHLERRKRQ